MDNVPTRYALGEEDAVVIEGIGADLAVLAVLHASVDFEVALFAEFVAYVVLVTEIFGAVVWVIKQPEFLLLVPVHQLALITEISNIKIAFTRILTAFRLLYFLAILA